MPQPQRASVSSFPNLRRSVVDSSISGCGNLGTSSLRLVNWRVARPSSSSLLRMGTGLDLEEPKPERCVLSRVPFLDKLLASNADLH